MRLVDSAKLKILRNNPDKIRNICILAHVDHGKTTLADSLVASNGIISQKMSGKLRYMDSRKDEQERGITMKSSSISLYYQLNDTDEYLVNVIDSPGHVDFSSEVSTAVRLCDGAIIVVDVVEGVCAQTQVSLKQAWLENIKPVLILNKMDRLILELKLTTLDAYMHLIQLLEQVNALMGEYFKNQVLENSERKILTKRISESDKSLNDNVNLLENWSDGLDKADDSNLYFSPERGNVIFASAIDGWGFCLEDFAKFYSKKLLLDVNRLKNCLWGNYYFDTKRKEIKEGAQEKAKKPLFVQFILENIWSLYDIICIRKDKEKLLRIMETLNVKLTARDLRHNDPKVQLQSFCNQWIPLSKSVLDMVCKFLPAANELSEEKVEKLLCSQGKNFQNLPEQSQTLKKTFLNCSSNECDPVIVFVSKMFPIDRKSLPENKPKILTEEELIKRRELARERLAAKLASPDDGIDVDENRENKPSDDSDDVFIAFARVYSGLFKTGQKIYVLGPKYNPEDYLNKKVLLNKLSEDITAAELKSNEHVTIATINNLYLMMGRELEIVDEMPAGNVVGIGGLEEYVLKSATLTTDLFCPAFTELRLMAVPILRVAVEPARPTDLPSLIKGLKLLNQADACVNVIVQETGEHVLVTAGEVHLEKCLDELKTRFAKVEINVSKPIVPFRETVVKPPVTDMVNEVIQEQVKKDTRSDKNIKIITITTLGKQSEIKIECATLSTPVTSLLERSGELLKLLDQLTIDINLNESSISDSSINIIDNEQIKDLINFKNELMESFRNSNENWPDDTVENIWSFGPKRCGSNILISRIPSHKMRSVWNKSNSADGVNEILREYDSSFVNGFQLASLAGPLCEEPMMGVAFIVHDWTIDSTISPITTFGPLSGQIVSAVKEGCRKSFQLQPQRLVAAFYSCEIQANADVLALMKATIIMAETLAM